MDRSTIEGLLKSIRDAVAGRQQGDDVVLPTFDPEINDNGAERWCSNIDAIAADLNWSSATTVAKAGKALKGSAFTWYETWDPEEGRTWGEFLSTIRDLYPEKRNLSEKLTKAVLYNSDFVDSYCEYAREKVRLLKNTKVTFTESQLVELVCGGITDVNIKMASHNSRVETTAELISLFTTYAKQPKKRNLDSNPKPNYQIDSPSTSKRPKVDETDKEKRCFLCGKTGHLKHQCFKYRNTLDFRPANPVSSPFPANKPQCTYCKRIGHEESVCFFKQRSNIPSNIDTTTG